MATIPAVSTSTTSVAASSADIALPQSASLLSPELLARAQDLAKQTVLDPSKPETVTNIGSEPQRASAAVSESLLSHVRVKDAGNAGQLLGRLSLTCKGVNPKSLSPTLLGKLTHALDHVPGISGLIHHGADTLIGYGKILNEVDSITKELQTARQTLLADNQSLNALYESNLTIFQQLQVWIEVCRIKRENLDSVVIPEARTQVGNSKDSVAAQRLADLVAMRERLDKHMHDLELTAMIRLQTAPKIRITQDGNLKLADKLESSVLNTIPLWKDNLALLITQQRQKEAAALEDQVDDTTNGLLRSSADMLHDNAVQIAKQGNRGVVDIATLQHTQEQLLKTIDETQQIAAQASKDREVARQQLTGMTSELKDKLAGAYGF